MSTARTFGTVSAVLLALLAVVPARDHWREFRGYQKGYLQMIRSRKDAPALLRRYQGGIQQMWLPEWNVLDRCTTCHMALKEPSLADVAAQPFRPHPPIPHSLTKFGCVECHRGQGAATTVAGAHRTTNSWEQPILPAQYLEAGCGQCHLDRPAGTPKLNEGRDLLARYGCVRCHVVQAADGVAMAATNNPPPLIHIAEKTTREWIAAWLRDPRAYSASATMPNFQLKEDEIRDISAFLMAQSSQRAQPEVRTAKADVGAEVGALLYRQSFCTTCHAMQKAGGSLVGGNIGPELTRIGMKARPGWIAAWLREPGAYDPLTPMPRYRFDGRQISQLTTYLAGMSDPGYAAPVKFGEAVQAEIERGRMLVNARGCAGCHEINGVKKPEHFAPDLTLVGSRPLGKIQWAEGVPHTLPDYISSKILYPRSFGVTLKMPQFTLTRSQVEALTVALLAQTSSAATLQTKLRVAGQRQTGYRPAGKAGQLMEELKCMSCHAINGHRGNGRGGDLAPDLSVEGSAVKRAWLVDFLQNPNTLRPALTRRMPKFNLRPGEAELLADYITTVFQRPSLDRDSVDAGKLTPVQAQRGKELFYGKYACQSCHIRDPKTDRGYIGPELTQVGTRLNAAWIYHWLRDRERVGQGKLEPVWDMDDDDAMALTAFLMKGAGR